jgi:hypothetical protein
VSKATLETVTKSFYGPTHDCQERQHLSAEPIEGVVVSLRAAIGVVIVCIIGVLMWRTVIKTQHGDGFPAYTTVQAGSTQEVTRSIDKTKLGWFKCGAIDRKCATIAVTRVPMVFTQKAAKPTAGCFTDRPPNKVHEIRAASSADGGRFTVKLSADMESITICSVGGLGNTDVVAIWSADPAAHRVY